MPQFIKMGLSTTGYIGRHSYERSLRKRLARRKILPGYPITKPFETLEAVRDYLAGDRVICLLCGKPYKDIGKHIKRIHNVSADDYRKQYHIPWTYGLVARTTSELYSKAIRRRIENGYDPANRSDIFVSLISKTKKRNKFYTEKEVNNLTVNEKLERGLDPYVNLRKFNGYKGGGYPRRTLIETSDGKFVSFTEYREMNRSHRGTEEFKKKMRERPQCQPEIAGKRLGDYWRGKKQSIEHIAKRFKKRLIKN